MIGKEMKVCQWGGGGSLAVNPDQHLTYRIMFVCLIVIALSCFHRLRAPVLGSRGFVTFKLWNLVLATEFCRVAEGVRLVTLEECAFYSAGKTLLLSIIAL